MSSSDEPLIVHETDQRSSKRAKILCFFLSTGALLVGAGLALALIILTLNKEPADYVVINAKIWTGEDYNPWAEALAVKVMLFQICVLDRF
jgi:hypothetical protein